MRIHQRATVLQVLKGIVDFGIPTLCIWEENYPLGKDPNAKIYLTFGPKCSIIRVSGWQAFSALPLGNVLASH